MSPEYGDRYTSLLPEPPLVSVIIANYNYGRFLRDAVDSAYSQTYPNIECIIVDDASSDDESDAALTQIEKDYPTAKILRRPQNGGQLAACLDGLAAARGDYVLFLDTDDILLKECISSHVFVHLSLGVPVGFTCCDMLVVTDGRVIRSSQFPIAFYVHEHAELRPPVRRFSKDLASSWSDSVDIDILDCLYSVAPEVTEWPWSQTSGMFFRREALALWANTPGLSDLQRSTDGFFARGINAITGSVIIDKSLALQRIHGANGFCDRLELMNLADFDLSKLEERTSKHRTALLNEVMRDPGRFNLFDRFQLKTILETFDTEDVSSDAPEWAKPSRLSHLLVTHFSSLAKILGAEFVVNWMRNRKIPEFLIAQASGSTSQLTNKRKLPTLSFVVVNFNYGKFLSECVDSIMAQTYRNVECIVVDNASTDNSKCILQELRRKYPSLKVVYNNENVGQSLACVKGLAISSGEYVAFIDADDYILPNFASTHIRAHLSLPIATGFTSADMVESVDGTLVLGGLAHFGKNHCTPISPDTLRDMNDVSVALESGELNDPELSASLRSVKRTNIDWVWAATSGTVYRRDAVKMFADNPRLVHLRFATDCYFNFAINALSGSVLIAKPLSVYRIHGDNNFTRRTGLDGTIAFRRESDDGARAVFLALSHIVANFSFFYGQSRSLLELWTAMHTLHRKSRQIQRNWGERLSSRLMKYYFTRVVAGIDRKLSRNSNFKSERS